MNDELLLLLVLVDKEEFGCRSLEVNILNYSTSDKVNIPLEHNLCTRYICISSLEYLGTDSNSNK